MPSVADLSKIPRLKSHCPPRRSFEAAQWGRPVKPTEALSRWFDAESKLHVVGLVASRADPVRVRGTSQAEASVKTMGAVRRPAPLLKRGEAGAAPDSDPRKSRPAPEVSARSPSLRLAGSWGVFLRGWSLSIHPMVAVVESIRP